MIAEDDLLTADMLADALVEVGYEVCGIARTFEDGVEIGDRCTPDFAILDIRLAEGKSRHGYRGSVAFSRQAWHPL